MTDPEYTPTTQDIVELALAGAYAAARAQGELDRVTFDAMIQRWRDTLPDERHLVYPHDEHPDVHCEYRECQRLGRWALILDGIGDFVRCEYHVAHGIPDGVVRWVLPIAQSKEWATP